MGLPAMSDPVAEHLGSQRFGSLVVAMVTGRQREAQSEGEVVERIVRESPTEFVAGEARLWHLKWVREVDAECHADFSMVIESFADKIEGLDHRKQMAATNLRDPLAETTLVSSQSCRDLEDVGGQVELSKFN